MWPNLVVAVDSSDTQRSTASSKLASVRASQSVLTELVVVQVAFAMLVERSKRRRRISCFMTVVIGEGVGGVRGGSW